MRDSYERFFSKGYITKKNFFNFGIEEIIYVDFDKASDGWKKLKQCIDNNEPVFMRKFGKKKNGNKLYQEFYKQILGNENVAIDNTNNNEPTKLIREMTGYSNIHNSKFELIRNYQVSHIFGRTKNIFSFTAPWNIVYLPKIIDPFTGHEAKGEIVNEFQTKFQKNSFHKFQPLIEDYNKLISDKIFLTRIDKYFKDISKDNQFRQEDIDGLEKSVRKELSPIGFSKV